MTWWTTVLASVRRRTPRERFEELTDAAKARAAKLYDPYPDADDEDPLHEDRDEYWVNFYTRGPDGRFMVERMDLRWPLAMTNMESPKARNRLLTEFATTFFRLRDRKVEAKSRAESRKP